MSKLT